MKLFVIVFVAVTGENAGFFLCTVDMNQFFYDTIFLSLVVITWPLLKEGKIVGHLFAWIF